MPQNSKPNLTPKQLKELTQLGINLDAKDDLNTALYRACTNGNTKIAELLIKAGADVNAKDKSGNTVLHNACIRDNTKLAKLLIRNGANPYLYNNKDSYSFNIAESKGFIKDLRQTYDEYNTAAIKYNDAIKDRKPLRAMGVSKNNYIPNTNSDIMSVIGSYLIKKKPTQEDHIKEAKDNINAEDNNGNTALYRACNNGHKEIAELLIKAGADVNAKGYDGYTALYRAYTNGNTKIAELLIKAGADVNAKDKSGNTVLYNTCTSIKNNTELAELLIKAGADVNPKGTDGCTALYRACTNGNTKIAELLIKAGADVNAKDKFGNTVLHNACIRDNTKLAELLIKAGADVNAKDKFGNTVLHNACIRDNTKLAELLIRNGANPYLENNRHINSFNIAKTNGFIKDIYPIYHKYDNAAIKYNDTIKYKPFRAIGVSKNNYIPNTNSDIMSVIGSYLIKKKPTHEDHIKEAEDNIKNRYNEKNKSNKAYSLNNLIESQKEFICFRTNKERNTSFTEKEINRREQVNQSKSLGSG